MLVSAELEQRYRQMLASARRSKFEANYDYRRFGASTGRKLLRRLKDNYLDLQRQLGRHTASNTIASNMDALSQLYERLEDGTSRDLLVQLLAYRTLGHRYINLPLNEPDYWSGLSGLEAIGTSSGENLGLLGDLAEYDLQLKGVPMRFLGVAAGVYAQILLEQYRCTGDDGTEIAVEPGDVVVDGGGCYGETALYFANLSGPDRQIFSFEFMPANLDIFERNLALNPLLEPRVHIVRNALWSKSGKTLGLSGEGPGTRVGPATGASSESTVDTLSIDDLIAHEDVDRLDFLKLDIEGAETEALRGAEGVIRRHRPKLAISVYHHLSDFWTIPEWIASLDLGYRFYLRHFTIHAEESVLFAVSDAERCVQGGGKLRSPHKV